ncbi:hypothetical protein CDO51_05150 [Natranaerobius trueperi]|uniref:PD-(D/E)XK nuclease superfamily protein n=1 Tax=Natranaerobius trueperi TaxID=759412 RepID=A0A226BYL2_9FIRM|nr:hypothetical protein CDO51_05150 [Natranaerobius trueperi]
MLSALLKGKLNPYNPGEINSEDLLTSIFFGFANYLDPNTFLKPFLSTAINYNGISLDFSKITESRIFFWPTFYQSREPDVVIVLKDNDDKTTVIIVECKLYSGKSNIEIKDQSSTLTGDQLVDQFYLGESEILKNKFDLPDNYEPYLLYLTAHLSYPGDDIEESLRAIHEDSIRQQFKDKLYWSNWQNAHHLIPTLSPYNDTEQTLLDDLKKFFENRRLFYFRGFENEGPRREIFQKDYIFWNSWEMDKPNISKTKTAFWQE